MKPTHQGVHWAAPTLMLGCLLLAILFAIGHDQFYRHFDHREIGSSMAQTIVASVAVAFAFIVKMFLIISTSTVFAQQLMYDLKRRGENISDIDSLFDVLKNILQFRKVRLWASHWTLLLLALITWCIPLAAVFTLGTLNVKSELQFNQNVPLRPMQPQQLWIGDQKYVSTRTDISAGYKMNGHEYSKLFVYGPTGELYSTTVAALSRREILPIQPPQENSSYSLNFFGPALQCQNASEEDLSAFNAALKTAYEQQYIPEGATILGSFEERAKALQLKYNAWIETPFWNLANPNWNNGSAAETSTFVPEGETILHMYLSNHLAQAEQAVLFSCQLYNATYAVNFVWDPVQKVRVQSVQTAELVPLNTTVVDDAPADYGGIVYNGVFQAFTQTVIGAATNVTYQQNDDQRDGAAPHGVAYSKTLVHVTALRDIIENQANDIPSTQDIITMVQSMFHNITVSTLSSQILSLPKEESQIIQGTTWRGVNVYSYKPKNLYIAYGCAILTTALCAAWGLILLYCLNQAAYSLSFSSIFRITRGSELDNAVPWMSRKGQDPIPLEVKDLKLRYHLDANCKNDGFLLINDAERYESLGTDEESMTHRRSGSSMSTLSWEKMYSEVSPRQYQNNDLWTKTLARIRPVRKKRYSLSQSSIWTDD